MIIEVEKDNTSAVKLPKMNEPVEFNDENQARVPAEVGEYLSSKLTGVEIVKDERSEGSNEGSDSDDASDEENEDNSEDNN